MERVAVRSYGEDIALRESGRRTPPPQRTVADGHFEPPCDSTLVEIQHGQLLETIITADYRNRARNALLLDLRPNAQKASAFVPFESRATVERDAGHHRVVSNRRPRANERLERGKAGVWNQSLAGELCCH